jgi:regulator of cell morphogenesis and NO signaling
MPSLDRQSTVAEIVLEHSECAQVFCDHRIDFCCRGERSVAVACAERGLDPEALLAALEHAIANRTERMVPDPRGMSTPELVSHIVSTHHTHLYAAMPFLEPLASKVARVHGEHNPKLSALRDAVRELFELLEPHMREEEGVLFPALTSPRADARLIEGELASMQQEHLTIGALLANVRALAHDFEAPDWACGSYRTLMKELAALEMDTLCHVHVETHVLMPRFASAVPRAVPAAS